MSDEEDAYNENDDDIDNDSVHSSASEFSSDSESEDDSDENSEVESDVEREPETTMVSGSASIKDMIKKWSKSSKTRARIVRNEPHYSGDARQLAKDQLKNTYPSLTAKHIQTLESLIWNVTIVHAKNSNMPCLQSNNTFWYTYMSNVYNTIHCKNIKTVVSELEKNVLGFYSSEYADLRHLQNERDKLMATPLEVQEGIHTCKCGSKRTCSYTMQVRSADEGATTFVTCVQCHRRWQMN